MNKDIIAAVVVVSVACVFGATLVAMRASRRLGQLPPEPAIQIVAEEPARLDPPPAPIVAPVVIAPREAPVVAPPPRENVQKAPLPKPKQSNAAAPVVMTESTAREALALVGADPAADEHWVQAINDPNFGDAFRSDLIEDLNDEGYENLRNLTPDDLILVQRRLALIEALAPDAMDETNAAAFREAHKDLTNMLARGSGN